MAKLPSRADRIPAAGEIVTSQRKLKKRAEALGMTGVELKLVEMLDEVLTDMRWMQILAYSNQYLLSHKLDLDQTERDQVLEAATRAVDKDQKFHEWRQRLGRLKSELSNIQRKVDHARADTGQDSSDEREATDGL